MSVIYKVITRPTDPRVPNSPKRFYPHLITLGQSVNLKYIAQKMRDRSSLSVGDIEKPGEGEGDGNEGGGSGEAPDPAA